MKEKIKKEVGWYKESIDHFLCVSCFSNIEGLNKEDYKPIYKEDLRGNVYVCDGCKKNMDNERDNSPIKTEETKIKTNELAIVGFVLGIVSILFSSIGIIPILALVFSGIGLYQAKERKEGGIILAIIGLILGIIYTLVYMRTYGHI